jgi:protein tyrosine kinase modulator
MRRFSPRVELAALAAIAPRFVRAGWVGAIALGLGLVGTAILTLSTVRLYRSETVLAFERGVQAGLGHEGDSPRAVAARLQDMVTARQRLESLIKEMKLYRKVQDKRGLVEAIEEMRRRISITNRDGYTYRISYDGESRDLAKDVLTRLTASVVDEDTKRRIQEAEDARRFLDAERKQADEDLKTKERVLAEFLTKHPQLASETGTANAGGLIRAADRERVGASGGEATALELQAAQLEESLAALGAPRTAGGPVTGAADPQLIAAHTRAQVELQAAQRDLIEKQAHLTNEHPDMKQALRRVAAAEASERRAAAALAAPRPAPGGETPAAAGEDPSTAARAAALRRALAAVRSQIASVKGRSAPRAETPQAPNVAVAVDTEWTRLNRDVSEARERQRSLESKQFQAQLAATLTAGGQGGQLVVVDPAFRPMRPVAGGRAKIALIGGAASVLLALLVIAAFAAFDDRLYAAQDVEGVLDDGIVVVIPKAIPRLPPMTAPEPEQAKES